MIDLHFTIPAKRVTLHVQDASGAGIGGININTSNSGGRLNESGLNIGGGITNASAESSYYDSPLTDASGNVVLWLLPNNYTSRYTFIATPPSGSIFSQFTLSIISVVSDRSDIIELQYSHNPPFTTISLSPDSHSDGIYSDPTIATLLATAGDGYKVGKYIL